MSASNDMLRWLAPQLRPGFKLHVAGGRSSAYNVLNPEGEIVRTADNQPVVIYPMNGWHYRKRTVSNLQKVGVIPKAKAKKEHTHATKSDVKGTATTNVRSDSPLEVAERIMKETRASARERSLAREVIRADEQIIKLGALLEEVRGRERVKTELVIQLAMRQMKKRYMPAEEMDNFMAQVETIRRAN